MTNTEKLQRAMQFLRVTDAQNNLSLTNIALVAALVKLLMAPQLALTELLPFIGALASYQVKRYLAPDTTPADDTQALKDAIASLQTNVSAMQLGQQLKR